MRIAIIGRPNVGKSALFNRLAGKRIAIVDAESGVTRDRLSTRISWNNAEFDLIDTGGLVPDPEGLEEHIAQQVSTACREADLILFAVDGATGRTSLDDRTMEILRTVDTPVRLVVNKCDSSDRDNAWTDFALYGCEKTYSLSALHGRYISPLLDDLAECAKNHNSVVVPQLTHIALAIVGQPNAGKSSLVNSILGNERCIVSDIPGTTRDAVDIPIAWQATHHGAPTEDSILLIDTAGIRRKRTTKTLLDAHSVKRAHAAIARADAVIHLFDAEKGITVTDKKIAALIQEAGKPCVLGINKWDIMKSHTDIPTYETELRSRIPYLSYAECVYLSAKTGQHVGELIRKACDSAYASRTEISTGQLNTVLHTAFKETPPPMQKGRRLKLFYATQKGIAPPTFLLFVNNPDRVTRAYELFIMRSLRDAFPFTGTPLHITWRERREQRIRQ